MHCVRGGQFTTGPRHTSYDDKMGGAEATLSVLRLVCCVCDNYQQAINTRAAPRFLHARYWIGTEPQYCIN